MFNQFKLDPKVFKAIEKMGFTAPTPVQEKTIPSVLEGRDVISLAETGSGKTIAYLAPTLTQVLANPNTNVLVLAPTRELATQIGTVIRDLSVFSGHISSVVIIGGAAMSMQVRGLRSKPNFMIATPGRLMDHVRQRTIDLRKVTHLILDEADRMFDMGFAPQVNEIVRMLPAQRQTMLFSATFPKEVRGLAERVLRDPIEIEVRTSDRPPVVIEQKVFETEQGAKNEKALDLINAAKGSVIIFTRTKSRTDRLTRFLEQHGVKVAHIHGDRSQNQRNKAIGDFKAGKVNVLVATDIAARGLDVPNISNVLNYDVPMTTDDYVHRIGRTGRAGQAGESLTFVARDEQESWNYIARKMGLPLIGKGAVAAKDGQLRHFGQPSGGRGGQRRPGGGGGRTGFAGVRGGGRNDGRGGKNFGQKKSFGSGRPPEDRRARPHDSERAASGGEPRAEQRPEQRRDEPRRDEPRREWSKGPKKPWGGPKGPRKEFNREGSHSSSGRSNGRPSSNSSKSW